MTAGLEVYYPESGLVQLTDNSTYFSLRDKGTFFVKAGWEVVSTDPLVTTYFRYLEIPVPIGYTGIPILAVSSTKYVTFNVTNSTTLGTVRFRFVTIEDQTIEWFLFDNLPPTLGAGFGLELRNSTNVVFDASNPILKPVSYFNSAGVESHTLLAGKKYAAVLTNIYHEVRSYGIWIPTSSDPDYDYYDWLFGNTWYYSACRINNNVVDFNEIYYDNGRRDSYVLETDQLPEVIYWPGYEEQQIFGRANMLIIDVTNF